MSGRLYESLSVYGNSDFYPFHMPGHKRNPESGALSDFYRLDITEIEGFDNLHQPETIIRDAQQRAAQLYHSQETYFLVNGSTAGILSAIFAVAGRTGRLVIARNCHRAVYHAAFLNRLKLYYVYPELLEEYDIAGPVLAENVRQVIQGILSQEGTPGQKASDLIAGVVITSPTYDGISSDINKIAETVHSYGLPLIVDQAHGAHFGLHPAFPDSAVREGADLVIHSVHKTLPAPTQTALIHRNGKLTDGELLKKYLRIYQSSSPSYLLMAGIDEAVRLAGQEGYERLGRLISYRKKFLNLVKACRYIRICPDTEPGKLVISVKDTPITGKELYDILREKYHLQMEMSAGSYVLGILTMMDTWEGIQRLGSALKEVDAGLADKQNVSERRAEENLGIYPGKGQASRLISRPKAISDLWEAYLGPCEETELSEVEGRIAAEFVQLYPPGIPLLVPGEEFNGSAVEKIKNYLKMGYTIQGVCNQKVKVVK